MSPTPNHPTESAPVASPDRRLAQPMPHAVPAAPAAPLQCHCGSTTFGAAQAVQFTMDGDTLVPRAYDGPDILTYSCLACGRTGTLDTLKGRLHAS